MLALIQNLASTPVLMETLQDDFSTGGAPDTTRWPATSGPTFVSLTGGACVITSGTGAVYSFVQSAPIYTIVNSYLSVQVTPATPAGANQSQQTYLSVDKDDNNYVAMYRDGNNLGWQKRQAGVDTNNTIATYNATTHAWWRIRHDGTGFRFGYSADGATWTETSAQTVTWTITNTMRTTMLVGKWDATDPAATGTFDNVNLPPAPGVAPTELGNLTLVGDNPSLSLDTAAAPNELGNLTLVGDSPSLSLATSAAPNELGNLTLVGDNPTVAVADTSAAPNGLGNLTLVGDNPSASTGDRAASPNELGNLTLAGGNPTLSLDTTCAPDTLGALTVAGGNPALSMVLAYSGTAAPLTLGLVRLVSDQATLTKPARPVVVPIVTRAATAPTPPKHLLGIGPWNASAVWRGAPNYGIGSGQRASVPHLTLPPADSKSITLRLNAASEASTSHVLPRSQTIIIQENATDLWWRRRDPRRGVIDMLGRLNAASVDLALQADGMVSTDVSYVDYQALLEDRLIMAYLNPGHSPPDIQWGNGTLITDILRWCVPTNMGLDLTGIQTATPDIGAKVKAVGFQVPLGTPLSDVFSQLQGVSDVPWEWWVAAPAAATSLPRLTLGTRGTDRGVALVNVSGQGPIATASLRHSGDKYANALYFIGNSGGVVRQYDDQVALYGERDATFSSDTVMNAKDVSGNLYLLNSAADKKLAELAAATPSYQIVLRPGYWEGRTHIDVGDWVGLRLAFGADVINGKWRVSEIQIDIDGDGQETVTLTLGTPRPSKDPRSRKSSTARLVRYLANYTVPEGA